MAALAGNGKGGDDLLPSPPQMAKSCNIPGAETRRPFSPHRNCSSPASVRRLCEAMNSTETRNAASLARSCAAPTMNGGGTRVRNELE